MSAYCPSEPRTGYLEFEGTNHTKYEAYLFFVLSKSALFFFSRRIRLYTVYVIVKYLLLCSMWTWTRTTIVTYRSWSFVWHFIVDLLFYGMCSIVDWNLRVQLADRKANRRLGGKVLQSRRGAGRGGRWIKWPFPPQSRSMLAVLVNWTRKSSVCVNIYGS